MHPTLAIDPGTTHSAFVVWNGAVQECGIVPNNELLEHVYTFHAAHIGSVAIEMIASYGMPVGRETFETVLWIGRFLEATEGAARLVYRLDVKVHLCKTAKAKDANVSQALRDKHGEVGTKKHPGPLFGVKSHIWSALAVADYAICNPL